MIYSGYCICGFKYPLEDEEDIDWDDFTAHQEFCEHRELTKSEIRWYQL